MSKSSCSTCAASYDSRLLERDTQRCFRCVLDDVNQREQLGLQDFLLFVAEKRVCAYCGEPATQKEHVVPQCMSIPTYVVPACSECNVLAGREFFPDGIREKQQFIHDRIRVRYRKLLRMPQWTQEEIDDLGPGLRSSIVYQERSREILHSRLAWEIPSLD